MEKLKRTRLSNQELEEQATDLRNNGQIDAAVGVYKELIKRFEDLGDVNRAANMQHMIGVSYKVANDAKASLVALVDAKRRYEQAGDIVGVGRVLRDEGITYQYVHDFDHALPLLKQSVDVLEDADDFAELGISQAKIGNLYMEQDDLVAAEEWLGCGLETLTSKTDHWFYIATVRLHIADLFLKKHEISKAQNEVGQAEKAFMDHGGEHNNARRLAQIEALKAVAFLRQDDLSQAKQCKIRCEELLDRLDDSSAIYLREQPGFREILEYKF